MTQLRKSRTYSENDGKVKTTIKIKFSSVGVFIGKSVNKILFVQPSLLREIKLMSSGSKGIAAVRAFWRK